MSNHFRRFASSEAFKSITQKVGIKDIYVSIIKTHVIGQIIYDNITNLPKEKLSSNERLKHVIHYFTIATFYGFYKGVFFPLYYPITIYNYLKN